MLWWFDSTRPHSPGDVALVAERLVCTEEVRVRLPPSPFRPSVLEFEDQRAEPAFRHRRLASEGAGEAPPGRSFASEIEEADRERERLPGLTGP